MLSKIRDLRIAQGLSAEQLAAKAGVTHTTIYNLEAGAGATVAVASRIAKALGTTIDDILEVPDEQRTECKPD